VKLANEIFSPSTEQIAWAGRLLEAMNEATAAGRGAASVDGKMIDMAHLKVAEIIQRKCDAIAASRLK
jgi:malyl-CoA/(S)-citramalyl-CoA lyase